MRPCDDKRIALGSYALGGLEPDEAAAVERHLAGCAGCRDDYARMAVLPAMLDRAGPVAAVEAAPSSQLERSVLDGFAAHRGVVRHRAPRRRRVVAATALAAAAACLAGLSAAGVLSGEPSGDRRVSLASAVGAGDARAEARLAGTSAGTRVELEAELPTLRRGELYELWFVRGEGRVSAGTFTVGRDGRADVTLTTAARAGRYERLGITREPDGLDPARNGPSLVVGSLRD